MINIYNCAGIISMIYVYKLP